MNKILLVGYIALIMFAGAMIFHGFPVTMLHYVVTNSSNIQMSTVYYGFFHNIYVYTFALIGMATPEIGLVTPIQSTYTSITPNTYFTVSAYGQANGTSRIRNNGANFGPDDGLGDQTFGINDAINAIPQITQSSTFIGGEIYVLPGVYNLNTYIMFNKSNTWLQFSYGAEISVSANPSWHVYGSPSAARSSIFIVRGLSNSRASGGYWIQQRSFTSSDNQEVTGLTISDNVSYFEYDHTIHNNISNFAIVYSGYFNTVVGTTGSSVGPFQYIHGHDNYTNNCGSSGNIDGGGCRISYNTPQLGPPHDVLVQNEIHTNNQMFGYDMNGGSSQPFVNIIIANPYIQTLSVANPSTTCMFFEGGTGLIQKVQVITPHLSGGSSTVIIGSAIGGGWTDVIWIGGIVELANGQGMTIASVSGTVTRWTWIGTAIKNNNQGGGSGNGQLYNSSGTNSGSITYMTYIGGFIGDDQLVATQLNGISLSHQGTGGGIWDSWTYLNVGFSGNTNDPILFNTSSAYQANTNIRFSGCPGFNPFGKVTSGFNSNTNIIEPQAAATVPVKGRTYAISMMNYYITSVAGAGVSITIQDGAGNNVAGITGAATLTAFRVPVGWQITWTWSSTAPTITIFGE
jgi:hypothetical protein